jgi:hypothetical protein
VLIHQIAPTVAAPIGLERMDFEKVLTVRETLAREARRARAQRLAIGAGGRT